MPVNGSIRSNKLSSRWSRFNASVRIVSSDIALKQKTKFYKHDRRRIDLFAQIS